MAPTQSKGLSYESEDVRLIPSFEKKGYRTIPILFVNGERVPDKLVSQARPNQSLLSFLREVMLLTGSKLGCAEGGCGACTVMLSKKDKQTNDIKHYSVNACLMPVLAADGCHVTTIEGIGTVKGDNLHPIQNAMVELHGSQCGFCTPGIIVAIYSIFANNSTTEYLEEHLDGNLCRCTGYRPIWDAARSLCVDAEERLVRGPCGTPCRECPERKECEMDCNTNDKAAEEEEKKYDDPGMCCSSSLDKAKETALEGSWLDQPNVMFPKSLLGDDPNFEAELAKPLIVVDRSEFHAGGTWVKPTTLVDLLNLISEFGSGGCKIVVGNTEVGIETRFKHAVYPRLIFPSDSIGSLFSFSVDSSQLVIGSCTPLATIQHNCEVLAKDSRLIRTVRPMHDMLRWFASSQIRNVASLGGNLVTASPISDMNPMLAAMGGKLIISSIGDDKKTVSTRALAVDNFFLKYRTVDLKPTELVERIEVPLANEIFEYIKPFKQARRREDDISIVTSGMRIRLAVDGDKWIIKDAAIAFGGMAPTTVLASETANVLIGSEFCHETFVKAREVALKELTLPYIVPGGQAAFRMTLVASFLYKFYLSVVADLKEDVMKVKGNPSLLSISFDQLPSTPTINEKELSGLETFVDAKKPSITGTQKYPPPRVVKGLEGKKYPETKAATAAAAAAAAAAGKDGTVGQAFPHQSGPLHCTGEALYTDDIPLPPSTLEACLILSSECGGILKGMDTEAALEVPGVVAVYTHEDVVSIGGDNKLGAIVHDENLFLPLGEKVQTVGQVLGIVVAESLESAELGARLVKIEYGEKTEKVIVSIEDAIEAQSFYKFACHTMERGDLGVIERLADTSEGSSALAVGDIVKVSGTFRCPGQEHFYLETNSSLVVPSESDTNLTIYASTQAATETQERCALATGTPASKVVVRVKRMGGGFGGKESRSIFVSCAAAVAAKISSRPVRLTLARDTDMSITGGRHAFVAHYSASAKITEEGAKLHALDVKLFSNGGWAFDLSGPVMDRALFHVDGCYYWPHFRAVGNVCKTAQPNHTAYRGFGGPQGNAVCEHIVEHLSVACKVPYDVMRRTNMYKNGDTVPFGMIMGEGFSGKWNIPAMWDRLYTDCHVAARRVEIEEFNSKHKWLKRGIAVLPTKFGIAFTAKHMNQGGALVHLYADGTVLVSHGGTEMGQGLHTKVCQVAAQAFGVPLDDVYVNDTSTDKVANTTPTAASMSTDMYGMATLDACRQILVRLEPIREKLGPDAPLRDVVKAAHMERIDLSAHGFFALDDDRCGYDWGKPRPEDFPSDAPANSWKGHPFNYFTQGVVCTEVEIEVLTGSHRTLRSDILMDVGSSINPGIDIGQIEGAFTQGMGWSTIEELIYADDDHTWVQPRGKLFTVGPGTYKIPAFNDVPESFNVTLMSNVDNPFAVHSSKAIGEPPFFLGSSVFFAAKEALRAARREYLGVDAYFEMHMPGTSERFRMHCADAIAEKAMTQVIGANKTVGIVEFQAQGSY